MQTLIKSLLLFVSVGSLFAGCSNLSKYRTPESAGLIASVETEQPSITATPTLSPEPTIDYKSTAEIAQRAADIAQATADEARRVNAMATLEWVQAVNEQVAFTAQSNVMTHEVDSWTATAADLYVPMTATQQAINNTQIPAQQAILSGMMTSTKEAPTQRVAMIQAENYKNFGKLDYIVRIFFLGTLGLFLFGLAIFFVRTPARPQTHDRSAPESVTSESTPVIYKQDKGGGYYSLKNYTVPCTPEQLTELAEKLTQGEKTLAINAWEGKGTLFTRDVILRVRAWLRNDQQHGGIEFVTPTDDGQLAPTGELFDFLIAWLETQRLPAEYEFIEAAEPRGEAALQPA